MFFSLLLSNDLQLARNKILILMLQVSLKHI